METLLVGLAEKTVIGAGLLLLIHYLTNRQTRTLDILVERNEQIGKHLVEFGGTLKEISTTMVSMDKRMEKLETRVSELEVMKREAV